MLTQELAWYQIRVHNPEKPLTHQRIGFDLNAPPMLDTVVPPIFAEGNLLKALGHKAPKPITAARQYPCGFAGIVAYRLRTISKP